MKFQKYETFILTEDLGTEIRKGMKGAILEVYDNGEAYEVEFVNKDGTNYLLEGNATFSLKPEKMTPINTST